MKKALVALGVLLFIILLIGLAFFADTNKRQVAGYWLQDYQRTDADYTLLLGSSSIARLPEDLLNKCTPLVIYGFDNGTTESIHSYLRYGRIENAARVIMYIGENDIARGEPSEITVKQVAELVNDIKNKTDVPIALLKLKYSPARISEHAQMVKFNEALETLYAQSSSVSLLPFDELSQAYLYVNDGIHLNKQGYKVFTQMINDYCSK